MQDIRTHMAAARKENRFSDEDQFNVEVLVNQWKKKNPDDFYYFRRCTDNENFIFLHQTVFQTKLLRKYGQDIVIMDATYNTSKYNLPLFFLAVQTNYGYQVVASFLFQHENTASISDALKVLKHHNSNWSPKAFMCDLDQRKIGAVEQTFENCKVYTCGFHREQAWSRWISKGSNGVSNNKEDILKNLRGIANSATVTEMEKNVAVLKGSEVYLNNPFFQRWVDRYWLGNRERWVRCYRDCETNIRVSKTNGVETMNRPFKHKYLKKSGGQKRLESLITVLCQKFVPDAEQGYKRKNVLASQTHRKYSDDIPAFLHNRPKHFIEHCMKRWRKVLQSELATTDAGLVVSVYHTDTEVPWCACADFSKTNWPCKHLLAVIQHTEHSWDKWPIQYTQMPCFVLDDGQTDPIDQPMLHQRHAQLNSSRRDKICEHLKFLTNAAYLVDNEEVLKSLEELLSQQAEEIKQFLPTVQGLPVRKPRKTTTKKVPSSQKQTQTQAYDEISRALVVTLVLDNILRSGPSMDAIVKVGPYTITNNSFHGISSTLPDEVLDGGLYLIARECERHSVFYMPTVICTSIFRRLDDVHNLLREALAYVRSNIERNFLKKEGLADKYVEYVLIKEALVHIMQKLTSCTYEEANETLTETEGRNLNRALAKAAKICEDVKQKWINK